MGRREKHKNGKEEIKEAMGQEIKERREDITEEHRTLQ